MNNYLIRRLPPNDYTGWKVIGVIYIPPEIRHLFNIFDCFKLDPQYWPGEADILVLPGISERVILIDSKVVDTSLWKTIVEQVTQEILDEQLNLSVQLVGNSKIN